MKIIEKIRIKNFRSFLGTRKDDKAEALEITDLNIFSGANDSGKSNILRALNLFFNDEINKDEKFSHTKDLNINKRETGNRVVTIKINFDISWDNKRDKFLPSKFSISKFYDINGFRNYLYEFQLKYINSPIRISSRSEDNKNIYKIFLQENFKELNEEEQKKDQQKAEKREWNYRIKFAGFLNKSVSFQYVPAIKDEGFFSYLYGKTISKILSNEESDIQKLKKKQSQIKNWKKTTATKVKAEFKKNLQDKKWREKEIDKINSKIESISKIESAIFSLEAQINNFSSKLFTSAKFLNSKFKVSDNLQEFFESFDIGTGDKKNIFLKLRGDGMQAKFIPEILNFLDNLHKDKKYFLWGFEEPENSSEYRNQQELAKKLKDNFSKNKQIFITTHSEEFLSIYDGNNIKEDKRRANLYHVKKIESKQYNDFFSIIVLFDVKRNTFRSELEKDLGPSLINAKYSKEIIENKKELVIEKKKIENLNKEIEDIKKPILFVEGPTDKILIETAWKKLNKKNTPFVIPELNDGNADRVRFKMENADTFQNEYIFGLFDFDAEGFNQWNSLKDRKFSDLHQDSLKCLTKKHLTKNYFILLLPLNKNRKLKKQLFDSNNEHFKSETTFQIEHMFYGINKEIDSNYFEKKSVSGGEKIFFKGNKKTFAGMTESFNKECFKNFKPLFDKIEELFEIKK